VGRSFPTLSLYPAAAAFPIIAQARRPHWTFRSLNSDRSCFGVSARRVAKRPIFLEGSDGGPTMAGPSGHTFDCASNPSGDTTISGSESWRCSDRAPKAPSSIDSNRVLPRRQDLQAIRLIRFRRAMCLANVLEAKHPRWLRLVTAGRGVIDDRAERRILHELSVRSSPRR
jgi:hypothetical protein